MNVSKIVTGVFRGQKDCDQRSRPNFKAKLYDNEGNRFYGTRRAFKLSLTKIYHLASVLATVRQLFASETASLLRCRGKKEKKPYYAFAFFRFVGGSKKLRSRSPRERLVVRFVEHPRRTNEDIAWIQRHDPDSPRVVFYRFDRIRLSYSIIGSITRLKSTG